MIFEYGFLSLTIIIVIVQSILLLVKKNDVRTLVRQDEESDHRRAQYSAICYITGVLITYIKDVEIDVYD